MSHGQAAAIRSCVESETFDLAGQNVATIEKTIREAFADPMDLSEMIRLTFIVGAGKLGRARYDDNAAKAVTATLREVGFEEDRGASSVMDCAGSFKLQHDTGKNLKTVVVFPKVTKSNQKGDEMDGNSVDQSMLVFHDEDSIQHKIAYSSMNVFPKMIENQCITWSQKKECVNVLLEIRQLATTIENSLVNGKSISVAEQNLFDSVSIASLDEKITFLRDCMQKQVERSELTAMEKQTLLNQVQKKIDELEHNISTAIKEGKAKRVETLQEAEKNAKIRLDKIKNTTPIPPPKLKNENEIIILLDELAPIIELKESSKGRLLTLKESQTVSKIEEMEEQIKLLEETSRGWFETDDAFCARVKAFRDSWRVSRKTKQNSKSKTAPTKSVTASSTRSKTSLSLTSLSLKSKTSTGKANTNKTSGGLFAAMMEDSDSD